MKQKIINPNTLSIIYILVISFLFFSPVIFKNKTFYAFDCLSYYYPWAGLDLEYSMKNLLISDPINSPAHYPKHIQFQKAIAENIFPFWSNSNFCGTPFNPYTYPLDNLLFSLFSITTAHDLLLFLHLIGVGLFTYIYLKQIGLKSLPSLTGSIAWMFNGCVMVWFEAEDTLMMACFLSAILFFIEKLRAKFSGLAFLGLVWVLSLSISVPWIILLIYQMFFIGAYILYRSIPKVNSDFTWSKTIKFCALNGSAVIISVAITINVFFLYLYQYGDSQRVPFAFNELFQETGQLPLQYLTTLLFPDIFGNPAFSISFTPKTSGPQPYNNYSELCIYCGIPTLFLVIACLVHFRKKFVKFFASTAVVTIFLAMGTFLYYPFAKFIPGLDTTTPTRVLFLFGFGLPDLF